MEIIVYTKPHCGFCVRAKQLLESKGLPYTEIVISDAETAEKLIGKTGCKTVPQIFINGEFIGGYTDLKKLDELGELDALLK